MANIDVYKFQNWLQLLNHSQKEKLTIDKKNYRYDWTEEVIIPETIYKILPNNDKDNWIYCDLKEIYSVKDIFELFGVKPSELNTCFSKRFYKLTKDELQNWSEFGKKFKSKLPVDDILIIYTQ